MSQQSMGNLGNFPVTFWAVKLLAVTSGPILPKSLFPSFWPLVTCSTILPIIVYDPSIQSTTVYIYIYIYIYIYRLVFLSRRTVDSADISNKQFYIKHPHKNVLACIRGRRLRLYSRIILYAPPCPHASSCCALFL